MTQQNVVNPSGQTDVLTGVNLPHELIERAATILRDRFDADCWAAEGAVRDILIVLASGCALKSVPPASQHVPTVP